MTQQIIDGFNEKKSSVGIFVDLQQAYDKVWRKGLYLKMQNTGIHGKLYKWIKDFLTDKIDPNKSPKCLLFQTCFGRRTPTRIFTKLYPVLNFP